MPSCRAQQSVQDCCATETSLHFLQHCALEAIFPWPSALSFQNSVRASEGMSEASTFETVSQTRERPNQPLFLFVTTFCAWKACCPGAKAAVISLFTMGPRKECPVPALVPILCRAPSKLTYVEPMYHGRTWGLKSLAMRQHQLKYAKFA